MIKRILSILLIILLVLSLIPTTIFADNNVDGIVTIDQEFTAGTLQDIVESTGIISATEVITLNIVASSGELNTEDIDYLNTMNNLHTLNVTSNIIVGDVGIGFLSNMASLINVYFPATTFGDDAFDSCYALANVSLPLATTFGDYAFYDCGALTSVELPSVTTFGSDAFDYCYSLTSINLPSVTTFGDYAFYDCGALISVELPSATTFGNDAFDFCCLLVNVDLPLVTTFGDYAFFDCEALTSVELPSAIVFGDDAFDSCYALENVNFSSVTTFGDYAFFDCEALTNVEMPSVTTFGSDAFDYCYSLTSINFPSATTFGDYAFYDCGALISVELPSTTTFGNDAFDYCYSLTSINFPSATTFGDYAFYDCEALTNVELPLVTKLGNNAFDYCSTLTSVNLSSATTFGSSLYQNVPSLVTMTLGSTIPTIISNFTDYDPVTKGAVVMVPSEKFSEYDSDDGNVDGMWFGWFLKTTYTVTFDSNGGNEVAEQIIYNNEKILEPSVPIKENYAFNGWYVDDEITRLWDFDVDTVNADMILYADWIKNPEITCATVDKESAETGSYFTFTIETNANTDKLAFYSEGVYHSQLTTTSSGVSRTVNGDTATWTYTIKVGRTGDRTFSFKAHNSVGWSHMADVNFTVTETQPPEISSVIVDKVSAVSGSIFTFTIETDADTDRIAFYSEGVYHSQLTTASSGVTKTVNGDTAIWTYAIKVGKTGERTFGFKTHNSIGWSEMEGVSFTVTEPQLPEITDGTVNPVDGEKGNHYTFTIETSADVNYLNFYADSGEITYKYIRQLTTSTSGVTRTVDGDTATWTYVIKIGTTGERIFSFKAHNSAGISNYYSINFTVNELTKPVIDSVTVDKEKGNAGETYTFEITANESVDCLALYTNTSTKDYRYIRRLYKTTSGVNVKINNDGTATWTYKIKIGSTGDRMFSFKAHNSTGWSGYGSVNFIVE
jgi:uncharacterized repeat protein (TIGR02543 family)